MVQIVKRDGTLTPFKKDKIVVAINKALIDVDGTLYETDTANDIADEIYKIAAMFPDRPLTVEDIQNAVEDYLMRSERRDVARSYIRYRYRKEVARNYSNDFIKAIKDKLNATDVQNQNANMDESSFGGRTGEASSVVTKQLALDYIVSPKARENHLNNEVYIHDLDAYYVGSHNCLSIPFDDLLAKGFNTRQTDVRPAGSINTAFQLVAVIFQLQSLQQFGGVSATHLDWTMVPYVRKSFYKHFMKGLKYCEADSINEMSEDLKLKFMGELHNELPIDSDLYKAPFVKAYKYAMDQTISETHQAVEGMYHNLNTLQSRSGNQLPFTSINYGTCTLPEGRMIIKALLEVSIEGLGALHKTSIFPCGIFQCMKGVNREPGDPNYDLFKLALRSTAQRLYPNYANVDWSGNAGYDINDPCTYFSTMGCRTANGWDVNGLGQRKDGRGNICPVTIILPTLAMQAVEAYRGIPCEDIEKDAVDLFMQILSTKISEAKDMLIERFEWICSQSPESAKFMYQNGLMTGYVPEEGIRSALKHGTLAIGQLGLAEALQILIGCDHTSPKGMELAKRIEQLFKDRCAAYKEMYKLNFGVYFTPAENLCYTALKKFRDRYGVIENVSDKEFFTNSMHVPVWKEMSPFEKIDIESQLTGYSSAGCITYIELDSTVKNNLDALEVLVNYAMDKDIPYFAINVPNDTCLSCGYTDEFNDHCPECGGTEIQQLRRVTGYLTGNYTTAFNLGKQDEVKYRVKHAEKLGEKSCAMQD
jgi:ribonucleoside-triphosphate reductase